MHKLVRTAVYNVFNEAAAPITCNFRVSADVALEVRHDKLLLLRNVDWLAANEPATGIVIGRQVLNALGLSNRVMLEAAMSRVGSDVDIPLLYASNDIRLEDDKEAAKVSSISLRGIMHSQGDQSDDDNTEESIYLDVGEDSEVDIKDAMRKSVL
ncbi:hypothetical protein FGB62_188g06 [Gracilaria domingensis]|nr:hypothetical protein FGB62_188g06 [Gracilaria domingensis]